MYNALKVIALIPAAGMGQRMGSGIKKQYLKLYNKEILNLTLIHMLSEPLIDEAIIIVPKEDVVEVSDKVKKWLDIENIDTLVQVIEGGATRQESVYNGLRMIEQNGSVESYVVIHDGVRPFFPKKRLIDFLESLAMNSDIEGAIAGVEVTDTLKTIDANKVITNTVDRSLVWAVQTPQVFNFNALIEAHKTAKKLLLHGTDDASLLEAIGKKSMIIQCPSENIKITKPIDLIVAEILFETYKVGL